MGINWEKSLKQYLVKKFKEQLGMDVEIGDINEIKMDFDLDYSELELKDLGMIYSLSIMTENFEATHRIQEELKKRNCTVKLNIDEKKRTGIVDIFVEPKEKLENIQINLIVTPDGMMVDWEKEKF